MGSDATLALEACHFSSNTANPVGGAIYATFDAMLEITSSTFVSNRAVSVTVAMELSS